MQECLNEVKQDEFELALNALRSSGFSDISGPYVHSAPSGNMYYGPFRQSAWVADGKTVLLKKEDLAAGGCSYFVSGALSERAAQAV